MENEWFAGSCEVTAYRFDEMLGTKFNAIYGRKKTCDQFDMDYVLKHVKPDIEKVLACLGKRQVWHRGSSHDRSRPRRACKPTRRDITLAET